MCVYSMVADHYRDKWERRDWFPPYEWPQRFPQIEREEIEKLKREVEEMRELLKRAKKYDAENGEPDCAMDEKIELIKKIAKLVGVDLGDALPQKP